MAPSELKREASLASANGMHILATCLNKLAGECTNWTYPKGVPPMSAFPIYDSNGKEL